MPFYQGILLAKTKSIFREIQYLFQIITCDPSMYKMDHSDCIVFSFVETFNGLKGVNIVFILGLGMAVDPDPPGGILATIIS